MGFLRLPEPVRQSLKNPLGELIGGPPSEVNARLKQIILRDMPPRVILVGDTISRNASQSGIRSDVVIIDGREMRTKSADFPFAGHEVYRTTNPAGNINTEAWQIVERAIRRGGGSIVEVDGEEDLLTLPAILSAPLGSFVVYGQPNKGIVLVRVSPEKQKEVRELVELMERVD